MIPITEITNTPGLPEAIKAAMEDFLTMYKEDELDKARTVNDVQFKPLKIETITKAFDLLKNLSIWIMTSCGIEISPPDITSHPDGSVEFEWKKHDYTYLSINVDGAGNNFSYLCNSIKAGFISDQNTIIPLANSRQSGIAQIFKKEIGT